MNTMPTRTVSPRRPRNARAESRRQRNRPRTRCPRSSRPRHVVLARYYDPTIGRFTATDPLINTNQTASLDAYGYGRGNPTTLTDPTGLDPDTSAIVREKARKQGGCTRSCVGGEPARPTPPASTGAVLSVKPESVAIFNAPAGPKELAGCGCETSGGDGFWDIFTNKNGLDDIADNPLNLVFAPWLADGAQILAAANECLDGGKASNCFYALGEIALTISGAKAVASTGRLTIRSAEILVDLGMNMTDRIVQRIKDGWGPTEEMAPLPFVPLAAEVLL